MKKPTLRQTIRNTLISSLFFGLVNSVAQAEDVESFLKRIKQTDSVLYGVFYDYRSYLDTYCNHVATLDDFAHFGASENSLQLLNIISESPDDDAAYMAALTQIPCPSAVTRGEELQAAQAQKVTWDTATPLSELDAERLLFAFITAYNEGDLEQLMGLFAKNARANNNEGVAQIRQEYQSLFEDTEIRQLIVQGVRWNVANNKGSGRGTYQITVLNRKDQSPRYYEGSLDLEFIKQEKGVQITRLIHQLAPSM